MDHADYVSMNWLVFVPLPFVVVYLVMCQDQRAVQKEGGRALQELSREDRAASRQSPPARRGH